MAQTLEHVVTTFSANLQDLTKTFVAHGRSIDAVKDVNLDVTPGEYVVILGPSGCGKSTLIRCIAGLESPSSGAIALNENTVYDAEKQIDVKVNARAVGMVFQNYALWPHMTVEKNIAYPLKMRKVPKADIDRRVKEVLVAVECEQFAKRLPFELSGGQQQRIALARAMVYEPAILLLDEPLSNLDALLRVSLRTELLRLHRKLGFTALHITHDQEEALEMGDRVVLMRSGKIEQMGKPEDVYARPVSPYAAVFLGVRNRLKATVSNGALNAGKVGIQGTEQVAAGLAEGTEVELFARARDTRVFRRGEAVATGGVHASTIEIDAVLSQTILGEGGRKQCILDVGGAEWFAHHAIGDLNIGDEVTVTIPASDALLYQGEDLVFPGA
jgi:iron(III) transport system ATP-binding protein